MRKLKLLVARNPQVYRWSLFAKHLLRFALRKPHDPDFAAFATLPERAGVFLDIGANAGQSALPFRIFNRRSPIVSVKPNGLLGSHDEVSSFFAEQQYEPYEYKAHEGRLRPPRDRSARNLFYLPQEMRPS